MPRGLNIRPNEAKLVFGLIPELGRIRPQAIQNKLKEVYAMDVPLQRILTVVGLLQRMSLVTKSRHGVLKIAPSGVDVVAAVTAHYDKRRAALHDKRVARGKAAAATRLAKTQPVPETQPAPVAPQPQDAFDGVMIVHNNFVAQSIRTKNYRLFALDENGTTVEVGEGEVKLPDTRGWLRKLLGL